MEKAKAFILTALVQLGYFAILLQAFVIPPALKSFRPCACSVIIPTPIKRLILISQLPSSQTDTFGTTKSENASGPKICEKRQSESAPPILQTLKLERQLEKLVFAVSAQVDLCVRLDGDGTVAWAQATSRALGDADERLIAKYVVENWLFRASKYENQNSLNGNYAYKLGVHEELYR